MVRVVLVINAPNLSFIFIKKQIPASIDLKFELLRV